MEAAGVSTKLSNANPQEHSLLAYFTELHVVGKETAAKTMLDLI